MVLVPLRDPDMGASRRPWISRVRLPSWTPTGTRFSRCSCCLSMFILWDLDLVSMPCIFRTRTACAVKLQTRSWTCRTWQGASSGGKRCVGAR
eukprot:4852894-Pyramimonas_sp.AAC.1